VSETSVPGEEWIEIDDGDVTWQVDAAFLRSRWRCTWGDGCQGILDRPAPELHQGCCSVGADLDEQDAFDVAALAATLSAEVWQYRDIGLDQGVIVSVPNDAASDDRRNTRVVDGACVFLNRPGFAAGMGCALHLAAAQEGDSPIGWKPSVCWQLPIRVEWSQRADGRDVAVLRRWRRDDWGADGEQMAWVCTEEEAPYSAEHPVIDTLADELTALTGVPVQVELRRRLAGAGPATPTE
jgi:hypothetical protein